MVIPRLDRFECLEETAFFAKANLKLWTDVLLQEMDEDALHDTSKAELAKLCDLAIRSKKATPEERKKKKRDELSSSPYSSTHYDADDSGIVSDGNLGGIVRGIQALEDPGLLERAVDSLSENFPDYAFKELGEGVARRDLDLWQTRYVTSNEAQFNLTVGQSGQSFPSHPFLPSPSHCTDCFRRYS